MRRRNRRIVRPRTARARAIVPPEQPEWAPLEQFCNTRGARHVRWNAHGTNIQFELEAVPGTGLWNRFFFACRRPFHIEMVRLLAIEQNVGAGG